MGGFATTLLTLSLSLMDLRGTSIEAIHTGNLVLVAGLGLLISAQWEMARGNTFSYTVLSAFGSSGHPDFLQTVQAKRLIPRSLLCILWPDDAAFHGHHRCLRRLHGSLLQCHGILPAK